MRLSLLNFLFCFWAVALIIPADGHTTPSQAASLRTYTIVIDAGHGGEDHGTQSGESDLIEKDLALDLCQKLHQVLSKEPNVRTILLRESDTQIPLFVRAEKANTLRAHVLLSLHVAHDSNPNTSGIRLFICSLPDIRKTTEGDPDQKPAIVLTPWEESQLPFQNRSNDLALLLQNELRSLYLNAPDIRSLPLLLLQVSAMPAVLIEVGNLADPLDVELLKKEDFRLRMVQLLKNALLRFLSENP